MHSSVYVSVAVHRVNCVFGSECGCKRESAIVPSAPCVRPRKSERECTLHKPSSSQEDYESTLSAALSSVQSMQLPAVQASLPHARGTYTTHAVHATLSRALSHIRHADRLASDNLISGSACLVTSSLMTLPQSDPPFPAGRLLRVCTRPYARSRISDARAEKATGGGRGGGARISPHKLGDGVGALLGRSAPVPMSSGARVLLLSHEPVASRDSFANRRGNRTLRGRV